MTTPWTWHAMPPEMSDMIADVLAATARCDLRAYEALLALACTSRDLAALVTPAKRLARHASRGLLVELPVATYMSSNFDKLDKKNPLAHDAMKLHLGMRFARCTDAVTALWLRYALRHNAADAILAKHHDPFFAAKETQNRIGFLTALLHEALGRLNFDAARALCVATRGALTPPLLAELWWMWAQTIGVNPRVNKRFFRAYGKIVGSLIVVDDPRHVFMRTFACYIQWGLFDRAESAPFGLHHSHVLMPKAAAAAAAHAKCDAVLVKMEHLLAWAARGERVLLPDFCAQLGMVPRVDAEDADGLMRPDAIVSLVPFGTLATVEHWDAWTDRILGATSAIRHFLAESLVGTFVDAAVVEPELFGTAAYLRHPAQLLWHVQPLTFFQLLFDRLLPALATREALTFPVAKLTSWRVWLSLTTYYIPRIYWSLAASDHVGTLGDLETIWHPTPLLMEFMAGDLDDATTRMCFVIKGVAFTLRAMLWCHATTSAAAYEHYVANEFCLREIVNVTAIVPPLTLLIAMSATFFEDVPLGEIVDEECCAIFCATLPFLRGANETQGRRLYDWVMAMTRDNGRQCRVVEDYLLGVLRALVASAPSLSSTTCAWQLRMAHIFAVVAGHVRLAHALCRDVHVPPLTSDVISALERFLWSLPDNGNANLRHTLIARMAAAAAVDTAMQ